MENNFWLILVGIGILSFVGQYVFRAWVAYRDLQEEIERQEAMERAKLKAAVDAMTQRAYDRMAQPLPAIVGPVTQAAIEAKRKRESTYDPVLPSFDYSSGLSSYNSGSSYSSDSWSGGGGDSSGGGASSDW